ncbi:hypothetical protein D3C81_1543040 [compost metagenome]
MSTGTTKDARLTNRKPTLCNLAIRCCNASSISAVGTAKKRLSSAMRKVCCRTSSLNRCSRPSSAPSSKENSRCNRCLRPTCSAIGACLIRYSRNFSFFKRSRNDCVSAARLSNSYSSSTGSSGRYNTRLVELGSRWKIRIAQSSCSNRVTFLHSTLVEPKTVSDGFSQTCNNTWYACQSTRHFI